MSQLTLEKRVAALENKMADLLAGNIALPLQKDWRRTLGMFKKEDGMEEIFEDAMRLREADRQKARKRYSRVRRRAS